jgi:UDP-glucose 4-epimerase
MILITGGLGSIGSQSRSAPDNYLDTTRLRQDTGFRPEYDVERAVPDYVGWLASNPR